MLINSVSLSFSNFDGPNIQPLTPPAEITVETKAQGLSRFSFPSSEHKVDLENTIALFIDAYKNQDIVKIEINTERHFIAKILPRLFENKSMIKAIEQVAISLIIFTKNERQALDQIFNKANCPQLKTMTMNNCVLSNNTKQPS